MADFDALIKQALKTQNSADLAVREKVYQSSRNALFRMLEKTGNIEAAAGKLHIAELEASIGRIEAEYTPSFVNPVEPTQPNEQQSVGSSLLGDNQPVNQQAPINAQFENVQTEPHLDTNISTHADASRLDAPNVDASSVNAPNVTADIQSPQGAQLGEVSQAQTSATNQVQHDYIQPIDPILQQKSEYQQHAEYQQSEIPPNNPEPALNYKRKSPILRRLSGLLMVLIVLGVVAWLAYAFISNLSKPTSGTAQQKVQEQQRIDKSSIYLDVLTPSDHSALVTAGRGTVEVVTELNTQYLRIQSIRNSPNNTASAEPILLEIQPGVLQKIAGKSVTIEIRTKSGNSEDGLFSVQCLVSGKSVCDRKRFPVGQQPENIIFALNLTEDAVHGDTFLAINTDVKSAVNASGAGSPIDILYVRARIPK